MSDWRRRLWAPDETSHAGFQAMRWALAPAEWLFRAAVGLRSWSYERGLLRSTPAALPAVCVGNLTVGGAGKTPISAWYVSQLQARGAAPAIVMRGYGNDELDVHRLLNPGAGVYASPNRVAGVRQAAAAGFDCAVLDDGFQHRAIRATFTVVLIAAEDWAERPRLLPRGPWRETPAALRRATLVAVTRKVAPAERSAEIAARIAALVPGVPVARVHIGLAGFVRLGGSLAPGAPAQLSGLHCGTAVAGVANPDALWRQLETAGVRIDERRSFPDHHRYGRDEAAYLVRRAAHGPLLATLKDAVKLIPMLPGDIVLHVPLQQVTWESGATEAQKIIEQLLDKRSVGR